jgi:hypothetical protein
MELQTPEQKKLFTIKLIKAIGDILRENKETPSGTLYTSLMAHGCTLQQYESIINIFKQAGRIKESNHLLIWQN